MRNMKISTKIIKKINKNCVEVVFMFTAVSMILLFFLNNYVHAVEFSEPVPAEINIPANLGQVVESYDPSGEGPEVVLIKDLHVNYEVQKNIKKIIEAISRDYEVTKIGLEGDPAGKVIDTSLMASIPDEKVKTRVLEFFMQRGLIKGPEAYSIKNNNSVELFGLENNKLYQNNKESFIKALKGRGEMVRYLDSLMKIVRDLEIKEYSGDLRRFRTQYFLYRQNEIQSDVFHRYLRRWSENIGKSVKSISPEYARYMDVSQRISKIDREKTQNEYEKLIESLELEKYGYENFSDIFLFSDSIYEKLEREISANGNYPNLADYIDAIQLMKEVNINLIVEEEKKVVDEIGYNLCRNNREENILFVADYLHYLVKFLLNQISKDELNYFYDKTDEFEERYRELGKKYGDRISSIDGVLSVLSSYVEEMRLFYRVALERDEHLVQNFLNNKCDDGIMIMNIGGFHSEGVSSFLEEEDVSYSIVMPRVTSHSGEMIEKYHRVLMGDIDISFDEFINDRLAPPSKLPNSQVERLVIMNAIVGTIMEMSNRPGAAVRLLKEEWTGFPGELRIRKTVEEGKVKFYIDVYSQGSQVACILYHDGEFSEVAQVPSVVNEDYKLVLAADEFLRIQRRGIQVDELSPVALAVITGKKSIGEVGERDAGIIQQGEMPHRTVMVEGHYYVYSPEEIMASIQQDRLILLSEIEKIGTHTEEQLKYLDAFVKEAIERRDSDDPRLRAISALAGEGLTTEGWEDVDYDDVFRSVSERFMEMLELLKQGEMPQDQLSLARAIQIDDWLRQQGITEEERTFMVQFALDLRMPADEFIYHLSRGVERAADEVEISDLSSLIGRREYVRLGMLSMLSGYSEKYDKIFSDLMKIFAVYQVSSRSTADVIEGADNFMRRLEDEGMDEPSTAVPALMILFTDVLFTEKIEAGQEELILGIDRAFENAGFMMQESQKQAVVAEVQRMCEELMGEKRFIRPVSGYGAMAVERQSREDRLNEGVENLVSAVMQLGEEMVRMPFRPIDAVAYAASGENPIAMFAYDLGGSEDSWSYAALERIRALGRPEADGLVPNINNFINVYHQL